MTTQRLVGVVEKSGMIACSCIFIDPEQLPPWGGKSLQKIRKMITDAARSDKGRPLIFYSLREINDRLKQTKIGRMDVSLYFTGRSRHQHGWRHFTLNP